jgi:hypothetical protein
MLDVSSIFAPHRKPPKKSFQKMLAFNERKRMMLIAQGEASTINVVVFHSGRQGRGERETTKVVAKTTWRQVVPVSAFLTGIVCTWAMPLRGGEPSTSVRDQSCSSSEKCYGCLSVAGAGGPVTARQGEFNNNKKIQGDRL